MSQNTLWVCSLQSSRLRLMNVAKDNHRFLTNSAGGRFKKKITGGRGVSNSPLPGGDDKILEESFAWQHEQNCLDSFFLT